LKHPLINFKQGNICMKRS